jgi:hypothetical protein
MVALNVGFVIGLMLRAAREHERLAALERLTVVLGELCAIVGSFDPRPPAAEVPPVVAAARGLH